MRKFLDKPKKRKSKLRKFISTACVGLLMGNTLLQAGASSLGVWADNKQGQTQETAITRVKNQIKVSAIEKSGSDTAVNFSPAELKTYGFFASNFLTPFQTKISTDNKTNKEILERAFSKGLGMQGDVEKIVNGVSKVMSKTEDLYLASSDDGGKTWKKLKDKATYWDMIYASSGDTTELFRYYDNDALHIYNRWGIDAKKVGYTKAEDNGNGLINNDGGIKGNVAENEDKNQNSEYISKLRLGFVTKDASKKPKRSQVLYETSLTRKTPATVAQSTFLANIFATPNQSYSRGYLYFEDDSVRKAVEGKNADAEIAKAIWDSLPKKEPGKFLFESSIYGSHLKVDGFGTIYSEQANGKDGAKNNYVIMPAAQNPMFYAQKNESAKSDSSDKDKSDKDSDKKDSDSSDKKDESNDKKASGPDKEDSDSEESDDKKSDDKKSDKSDKDDKSSKKSKKSGDKNSSKKGTKDSSMQEWLDGLYNDESTGVGKSNVLTNLQAMALQQAGIVNYGKDGATSYLTGEATLNPYGQADKGGWDEAGGEDAGAKLQDWLLTTFVIQKVDVHKGSFRPKMSVSDIKTDITKFLGTDYDYNSLAKGSNYLSTEGYFKHRLSWPTGAQSAGNWIAGFHQALGAKAGSADVHHITMGETDSASAKTIDSIVSFDKYGFEGASEPGDVIKNTHLLTNGDELSLGESKEALSGNVWVSDSTSEDSPLMNGKISKLGANVLISYLLSRADPKNENVDFVINLEGTPEVTNEDADAASDDDLSDSDQDAILKNMAYWMLNPTKGREYKQRWSKTFINNILLVSLEDMVGANTASSYGGTTRYLEMTGFGTIPRTSEVKLTAYLYNNFSQWGIFILILAFILMVVFVFTGMIKIVPAFLSLAAFGIIIYTPPKMIDSAVNISNAISSSFYKDKFYFWALYQHQNYEDSLNQLQDAAESGDSDGYNQLLLTLQGGTGEQDDVYEWQQTLGATVKVRWMAPKKDGYVTQAQRGLQKQAPKEEEKEKADKEQEDTRDDLKQGTSDYDKSFSNGLTKSLLNQGISNEDYTGLDVNYLYRGYTDISDYSRFYYGNIMGDNLTGNGTVDHQIGSYSESLAKMFPIDATASKVEGSSTNVSMAEQRKSMLDYLSTTSNGDGNEDLDLAQRASKGFINNRQSDGEGNTSIDTKYFKRIYAPISSNTVSTQSTQSIGTLKVGDTVGLSKNYFIPSIRDFNNHKDSMNTIMGKLNEGYGDTTIDSGDSVSLSTFALYTESPFYYFSWNLYDNGMKTAKGNSGEFKKMMLENNDSFFYNYKIKQGTSGYGAMKDFMDMGSLFRVIIPYLREANKPLLSWSDKYGTKPFEGYGADQESLDAIQDKNSEAYYKTWFNLSEDNLYRTYSAWVDALYDTEMAKPQTIKYGGKTEEVKEPLNPASYHIRPMVFSESEMDYYGIKDYELTKVEQTIMKTQKDIRNDWLQLMNYYNLDDSVLNTAAAMIATFDFNKNFSQTAFNQEQIVLEPQGFELKTFGWDAYLRMILQGATGESISYNKDLKSDIYEIVAEKDGTVTVIMMWVQSFIVVYVMPAVLLIVMILLPIAMLLSVLSSYVKLDRGAVKSFGRDCFLPFVIVLLSQIGVSFVVSRLMGDAGTTLVTGDLNGTSSFNSPRSTLGILLFVTAIAVALDAIALRNLIRGVINNGKVVVVPIKATIEAIGGVVASKVTGGFSRLAGGTGRSTGSSSSSSRGGYGVGGGASNGSNRNPAQGMSPEELSRNNMNDSGFRRWRNRRKMAQADASTEERANRRLSILGFRKKRKPKKPSTFNDLLDKEAKDRANGRLNKDE